MSHPSYTLQKIVERARHLYSLPAVALRVLELTNQPHVDVRALKDCIENDPALTAKVLRVVNSSLFGLSREVSDLNQALALLGTKPLKLLVLGFSLSDVVFSRFTGKILLRYWRHTLTKAIAAREIAERVCHVAGDEAFVAALLQDIGMLVLLQELGEPYAKLIRTAAASRDQLAQTEVQALGFDHTELTAHLLAHWGMSESLQQAVVVPRDAEASATARGLPRIVQLAHLLADLVVDGQLDRLDALLEASRTQEHLTQTQLAVLVESLQEKVAQLADTFSLELPPGMDYRDVLVHAQQKMAEVSTELATELVEQHRPTRAPTFEGAEVLTDVEHLSAIVAQFIAEPTAALSPVAAAHAATAATPRPHLSGFFSPCAPEPSDQQGEVGERQLRDLLEWMVPSCRQSRRSLSLALIEISQFDTLRERVGPVAAAHLAELVQRACRRIDVPLARCVTLSDRAFALVMPDCDRQQATRAGRQLVEDLKRVIPARSSSTATVCGVGIATADGMAKNFSPDTLWDGARGCLSAAQLSGGHALKSIAVY